MSDQLEVHYNNETGRAAPDALASSCACYFFSIYWPKGALQSTGVGTFIHGVNSGIDI